MVKQKLRIILLTLLAALVFLPAKLSAEYTFKPKVGLWFGPTTPLFSTSTTVDGYLGGGIFARTNLPHNDFFFNLDGSWLHFSSRVDNRLDLYPIVGSVLYRLPLQLPVQILLKGGAGASYVKIRPEYRVGWDPQLLFGSEFYFPAGKIVRIGLRVDFLWTVEQHIKSEERYLYDGNGYKTVSDGQRGGYTMYIGLMAFFNLVK